MLPGSRWKGLLLALVLGVSGTLPGACMWPAGYYDLETLPESDIWLEKLTLTAVKAQLYHDPVQGWDLHLTIGMQAKTGYRPLVDFSRLMLRADEVLWMECDSPDDVQVDSLRFRVEGEEPVVINVVCQSVQRPESKLEIRFPATGAGGRGYAELSFSGLKRGDM